VKVDAQFGRDINKIRASPRIRSQTRPDTLPGDVVLGETNQQLIRLVREQHRFRPAPVTEHERLCVGTERAELRQQLLVMSFSRFAILS